MRAALRRSKVNDVTILQHRPMAMETVLVKDAGYALREIRGETEIHRMTEEPDDIVAALGRVTPRVARIGAIGVVGLGVLLAAETGLVGPLMASLGAAGLVAWVGEFDASATETEHEIHRPGMTEREVHQRWVLHDEHEQLKEDKAEESRKRAERKAKSAGG